MHEFREIGLPDRGKRVRAMAARLLAGRNQHVAAALHATDLPLHDPQLRRIDLIIGGVHRDEWGDDFFEIGRWIVEP